MRRTGWIVLVAVLLITFFAVVVGGFFWPRPQFRKGPWSTEPPAAVDSLHEAPR